MAHAPPQPHLSYTNIDMRINLPHDTNLVSFGDTIMDSDPNVSSAPFRSPRNSSVDLGVAHSSTTTWGTNYHFQSDPSSLSQIHTAINSFPDAGNYTQHKPTDGLHTTHFTNQHGLWSLNENSGSCTPTRSHVGPDSENSTSLASLTNHLGQSTPNVLGNPLDSHGVNASDTNQTSRVSPQLCKEWASMSSADQAGGDWSVLSESHPSSPSYLGSIDVLRRDGIRKKNARFEIPAERNLQTIDKLISTTTDEHQIKELKQQKRLLRNRQAALDSRQRKKQHTERLEEEKKSFTTYINELEEEIMALRLRDQEWVREKERWAVSQQNCQQYIESLALEKDEIIRNFTIETGELRKKNLHLADQVRQLETMTMSAAPTSTGFSTDFSEFDHVAAQSSPWEHFSSINDFSIENEQPPGPILPAPAQSAKPATKLEDVSTASSLILLLLLCGAWVASRNPQTNSTFPRMPDDVRLASATVLDHLYQDAGLDSRQSSEVKSVDISGFEVVHAGQVPKIDFSNPSQQHESPLDALHRHLTAPTDDQIREQVMSLTPSQYHGISADSTFESPKPFNHNRRSLQDSLAVLRRQSQTNSVESYTRSILWEKLPKEIVKDFARLMAENANVQPWKIEPGS